MAIWAAANRSTSKLPCKKIVARPSQTARGARGSARSSVRPPPGPPCVSTDTARAMATATLIAAPRLSSESTSVLDDPRPIQLRRQRLAGLVREVSYDDPGPAHGERLTVAAPGPPPLPRPVRSIP